MNKEVPCFNNTDLFFPPKLHYKARRGLVVSKAVRQQVDKAVAVCETCPEKSNCKDMAVSNGELTGVWGGIWFDYPPDIEQKLTRQELKVHDRAKMRNTEIRRRAPRSDL